MPHKPVQSNLPALEESGIGKTLNPDSILETVNQHSSAKFRLFVEYMPIAVAMVDCEMRYLAGSRRWHKEWGFDNTDLSGHFLYQIFPNLSPLWQKNAQECLTGRGKSCEWVESSFIVSSHNGQNIIKSVKWGLQPWFNDDGSTIGGLICTTELTQNELENALELTQLAIDKAADSVFWITSDGSFYYINEAAFRSLNYSRKELLNLTIFDINLDLKISEWLEHWQKVKEEGSLTFEARHLRKNGEIFPVEFTVNYLEFNGIEYHCAFAHDISQRKKAQAALIDAKEQLEAVLNAVPGFVSWVNSDFRYLGVNRHLANAYNLASEEFIDQEIGFLETSPYFNELVYDFLSSSEWTTSREVTTTVKGKPRTYLIAAQKYHQGRAAVFVGLDITEREQMEKALRLSEEKYRTLTHNFPNGAVILFDPNLCYTLAEGTELEKIGLSKKLMEGKTLFDVFPLEIAEQIYPYYQEAFAGYARVWELEYLQQIYLCYTLPLQNEYGDVFAGMMMIQNITERKSAMVALQESEEKLRQKAMELEHTLLELKRTQTQLIQREKMSALGQLVAGVAHEINNPVNFISGNLTHASNYIKDLLELIDLYKQYYPHPIEEITDKLEDTGLEFLRKDLPKLLDSMKFGSDRIREVVRSLRLFSRTDESEMKVVDIQEGIESTLLILQNRLQAKGGRPGISLIKEYGNLPRVHCYASQLNQVFMHLLNYTIDELEESFVGSKWISDDEQPILRIRTDVEGNTIAISIQNNGQGMTEEVRQTIFEPPVLRNELTTGKERGLGLSISYHLIVEKQGGELQCLSELGHGTEFIIKIPLVIEER